MVSSRRSVEAAAAGVLAKRRSVEVVVVVSTCPSVEAAAEAKGLLFFSQEAFPHPFRSVREAEAEAAAAGLQLFVEEAHPLPSLSALAAAVEAALHSSEVEAAAFAHEHPSRRPRHP